MEDRFRFRAWNFKENKYYQQNEKGMFKLGGELPNGTPIGVLCSVEDLTNNRNYGKNFVVEQCTGLKDKNGKLIYEGDIVSCNFSGKANTAETFAKKVFQGKHIVEFCEYYFAPFNCVNASDLEVIGNIHENPELLEED